MSGNSRQYYQKEGEWRRAFRRLAQLPFRSVGLNVSRRSDPLDGWQYADLSPAEKELVRFARPYTMTSIESLCALINAIRYVVDEGIQGDIVECGVWRGGNMAAAARTLAEMNSFDRSLYLFDTFEGMPQPGQRDINCEGDKAQDIYRHNKQSGDGSDWCFASEEEVMELMSGCGYDETKIHLVKGRVEETVPSKAPEKISVLRLDTDWYDSTRHELQHLFPRLESGGIIIIDDYGHWQGARDATDQYLAQNGISIFLQRVDYTVRLGVKL
jgi:O-methyltransferase